MTDRDDELKNAAIEIIEASAVKDPQGVTRVALTVIATHGLAGVFGLSWFIAGVIAKLETPEMVEAFDACRPERISEEEFRDLRQFVNARKNNDMVLAAVVFGADFQQGAKMMYCLAGLAGGMTAAFLNGLGY